MQLQKEKVPERHAHITASHNPYERHQTITRMKDTYLRIYVGNELRRDALEVGEGGEALEGVVSVLYHDVRVPDLIQCIACLLERLVYLRRQETSGGKR